MIMIAMNNANKKAENFLILRLFRQLYEGVFYLLALSGTVIRLQAQDQNLLPVIVF